MICPYNVETKESKKEKTKKKDIDYVVLLNEINQEIIEYANENNLPILENGDIILENSSNEFPSLRMVDGGSTVYSNVNTVSWNINKLELNVKWSYSKASANKPKFKTASTLATFGTVATEFVGIFSAGWVSKLAQVLAMFYGAVAAFTNWYYKQLTNVLNQISNAGLANRLGVQTVFKLSSDINNLVSCKVLMQ